MVSTNSATSTFASYVLNGNNRHDVEASEDFAVIATQVLKRVGPILQYVITEPLARALGGLVFKPSAYHSEASRLKVMLIGTGVKEPRANVYWVLSHDGKFYKVETRITQTAVMDINNFVMHTPLTAEAVYAEMVELYPRPLEVFLTKLYEDLADSIKLVDERLGNMRGRTYWLAEALGRYQSSVEMPQS